MGLPPQKKVLTGEGRKGGTQEMTEVWLKESLVLESWQLCEIKKARTSWVWTPMTSPRADDLLSLIVTPTPKLTNTLQDTFHQTLNNFSIIAFNTKMH